MAKIPELLRPERTSPFNGILLFASTEFLAIGKRTKRTAASRMFGIDIAVLGKLGDLTMNRGDARTARKAAGMLSPLSDRECAWIESAIKKIIYRVGEFQSGEHLSKITMSDLPPL